MTTLKGKTIVLAGGGTGGHIFPLLAVAKTAQAQGAELIFIGAAASLEERLAKEHHLRFFAIPVGKWRRYFSLANFLTPLRYWQGIKAARQVLAKVRPDVVLAKGGYVSLPTVKAAAQLKIPIVIHESDAVVGWANRQAARVAQKICVSFAKRTYPELPADKLVETGLPVTEPFLKKGEKKTALKRPLLLVMGGSQGAQALNRVIMKVLPKLLRRVRVVHLVGERNYPSHPNPKAEDYQALPSVSQVELASLLTQADLVCSRAGASALAEIAAIGRPVILVPLPSAANDHQVANAAIWEVAHAAVVIPQAALTPERLLADVTDILDHPEKASALAAAAQTFAHPQAAEQILAVVAEVSEKGKR